MAIPYKSAAMVMAPYLREPARSADGRQGLYFHNLTRYFPGGILSSVLIANVSRP